MIEEVEKNNLVEKIGRYDTIEIFVNDKREMLFEGIIDPVYIEMHFERILKSSKDFDMVKMIGYHGKKSKELIAEVFVNNRYY